MTFFFYQWDSSTAKTIEEVCRPQGRLFGKMRVSWSAYELFSWPLYTRSAYTSYTPKFELVNVFCGPICKKQQIYFEETRCPYKYIYIYIYIYVDIYVCVYIYIYIYIYICVCIYIYLYIYMCVYIYIFIYIYICVCIYIIYIYIYICVCVYI